MADALVWGASGAIGSAIVDKLKTEGWRVFAAARDETTIPASADFTYPFDAGDANSIAQTVTLCAHETTGLDLVVYAAGGLAAGQLEKLSPQEWQQTINANLTGAYLAARSSINLLGKGGHLMIIGAKVDKITLPRMGAYATAKAGLETMVQILQKENRKLKVTIIRPPAVDTPFWENVPFKLPDGALQPAHVADAILKQYAADASGELNLEPLT